MMKRLGDRKMLHKEKISSDRSIEEQKKRMEQIGGNDDNIG